MNLIVVLFGEARRKGRAWRVSDRVERRKVPAMCESRSGFILEIRQCVCVCVCVCVCAATASLNNRAIYRQYIQFYLIPALTVIKYLKCNIYVMLIINSTLFSSCLKLFRLSVFRACTGRLFHRRLVIYSIAGARGSSVMSE